MSQDKRFRNSSTGPSYSTARMANWGAGNTCPKDCMDPDPDAVKATAERLQAEHPDWTSRHVWDRAHIEALKVSK